MHRSEAESIKQTAEKKVQMLHIFSSKTDGHKTYIEGNLNFHSDLQKIHLRSTHSTSSLLIVQSLPHKSFQALSFHVFPKIPWIFEREITIMVCPGKNCAFSKVQSSYLQNPAQCIFKSQSCTILSWASLVHCKQGDAHLEMQMQSILKLQQKTFSFSKFANYISFGLPVQKMSSLLCTGATCRNSGGTSGENEVEVEMSR